MKLLLTVFIISFFTTGQAKADYECTGKFPNPITDYCWSCVFPLKLAGIELPFIRGQEDNDSSGGSPVCTCGSGIDIEIGLLTSFWEPTALVDVVRKPYCMAGLGGIDLGNITDAPRHGVSTIDGGAVSQNSFYHIHWYMNPIMSWIGLGIDNSCIDQLPFDVAYLTEIDPLWIDDELNAILSPDVNLFASMLAQAACTADCVSSSAGFPISSLYWCAGCQGAMLPTVGTVAHHTGMVDSTSLLLQRFTHKGHRQLMIWGASGEDGMCHKYPKYLMDKSDFKYTMVYPRPQRKILGTCCQPLGRTTALWGSAKEFPFKGEDAVYQMFRKRDCCIGTKLRNAVQ
jgi:conjugal transfer pilus assembly protein TraU